MPRKTREKPEPVSTEPVTAEKEQPEKVELSKSASLAGDEMRYQWPPPRDPSLSYQNKTRNPVQSVITALPILMVVAGLYFYFHKESQQTHGVPVMEEAVELTGVFTGLSATSGRHYLWIEQGEGNQAVRIRPEQVDALEELDRGTPVELTMAPSVAGSKTYWALYVEQSGKTYFDLRDRGDLRGSGDSAPQGLQQ